MSLYGALFSGVSGLNAQSNKLGVISDNISNVNTVGYKAAVGSFGTLVTNSGTTTSYSPGGVIGGSRAQVSKQGLLQTTTSPTDIGIQGAGFFVVNQAADGSGQVQYTRAGSFTADKTGNFKNAAGLYLQAWPLDRDGHLPGEPGNLNTTSSANLSSLETVNLTALSGSAAATTSVALSANLQTTQTAFPGAAGQAIMDALDVNNKNLTTKSVIVPSTINGTSRGDRFVVSTGAGVSYTYTYGGFSFGRDITSAANGDSGAALLNPSPTTLTGTSLSVAIGDVDVTNGSSTVTITEVAHGLITGDYISFAVSPTLTGSGLTLTGPYRITKVNDDTFTLDAGSNSTATVGSSGSASTLNIHPFATAGGAAALDTTDPGKNDTTVQVRQVGHGLKDGDVVTLSGFTAALDIIPAAQLNSSFKIDVIDDDHYTITTQTAATSVTGGGTGTIISSSRPFIGNILDATNTNSPFLGTTGIAAFSEAALSFTITTSTTGTVKFTYATTANTATGIFNSLTTLADAINNVPGLSARIVNNRLYVSPTDSNEAITFANTQDIGDSTTGSLLRGIDWVAELGLRNVVSGSNRFATLEGLAEIVNNSPGLTATLNGQSTNNASVSINVTEPLDTVTFVDKPDVDPLAALSGNQFTTVSGSSVVTITMPSTISFATGDVITLSGTLSDGGSDVNGIAESAFSGTFEITKTGNNTFTVDLGSANKATSGGAADATGLVVTPPNNTGSILASLGLVDSLNGDTYTAQSTGALGPSYDPTDIDKNMASGSITPHISFPQTIYDAQGQGHNLSISFLKTAVNTWAVEVFASPATDVTSTLPNGQIAYGTLTFNGDGTLRSVSSGLLTEASIQWTNGASPSAVTFNWGTAGQPAGTANATVIGLADGLSQTSGNYLLNSQSQNGAPVGKLTGVSIDQNGFITASYNNGETQRLFKIPLASFTNPDELQAVSGNAYIQTNDSGEVNLKQSNTSGVGYIASSQLEASNVELADQLTDMIVAQRAYQANTKVISTADQLLDNLNQILR